MLDNTPKPTTVYDLMCDIIGHATSLTVHGKFKLDQAALFRINTAVEEELIAVGHAMDDAWIAAHPVEWEASLIEHDRERYQPLIDILPLEEVRMELRGILGNNPAFFEWIDSLPLKAARAALLTLYLKEGVDTRAALKVQP